MARTSRDLVRSGPVIVLALLTLAGCRGLPVFRGVASPRISPDTTAIGEAPARCAFPRGTVLAYAGRSTTAALDVEEVVGDPMSTELADIYITRDAFDQGDHHGRLVCAIFVNDPEFVEITVHPSDGGRVSLRHPSRPWARRHRPASPARQPLPQPAPPCRIRGRGNRVLCRRCRCGSFSTDARALRLGSRAAPRPMDLVVFFSRGDRGITIVLDYVSGTVYGSNRSDHELSSGTERCAEA